MATSASIPEASSSLPKARNTMHYETPRTVSFQRSRPRSRVVVLSRRPARVRNPARKLSTTASCPRPTHGSNPQQVHDTKYIDASSYRVRELPKRVSLHVANGPSSDVASFVDPSWEPSELSVDLDSFPMPPSKVAPNQHKPPITPVTTGAGDVHVRSGPAITANPREQACAPKDVSSPQRRLAPPQFRNSRSSRGWFLNGAADLASASKHTSSDSALVEAISRSICQQLLLFAVTSNSDRSERSPQESKVVPTSRHTSHPRAADRSSSLDHFTENLQSYVEKTKASGKVTKPPPTPAKSGTSLRTVSPLLPFRPEFKAAGLAVTSKDQRPRFPSSYITRAVASQGTRRSRLFGGIRKTQIPWFDGHQEKGESLESISEISFAPSQDMDEWRYALIDEAPIRKQRRRLARKKEKKEKEKKPKSHCLSCFPTDDESVADGEWAHFRPATSNPVSRLPVSMIDRDRPPTPPPKPAPLALPDRGKEPRSRGESAPRSPRHIHGRPGETEGREAARAKAKCSSVRLKPQPKVTGLRRPSMTLPRDNPYVEACRGGHYDGEPSYKDSDYPQTRTSRAQTIQPLDTTRLTTERERNQYRRPFQSLPARKIAEELPRADRLNSEFINDGSPTCRMRAPKSGRNSEQPRLSFDPDHMGVCCRSSRGISTGANARPNIPTRTSSIQDSVQSTTDDDYDDEIVDRDVLRGLHIAASAACDQEIDSFVRSKTGLRIRRFLADLMMLETLRDIRSGEDSGRGAKQRRSNMRKLKRQVRQSRELGKTGMAT